MMKDNPKRTAKKAAKVTRKMAKNVGKNIKRGEKNIAKGNDKSLKYSLKSTAKGGFRGTTKKERIKGMRGEKRAEQGGKMVANPSATGRMKRDRLNVNAPDMNRPGYELTPYGKSVPSKQLMDKWAAENAAEKAAKKQAKAAKRKRTAVKK